MGLRAQRRRPTTGEEGLIGEEGVAIADAVLAIGPAGWRQS
mgnify:CR=1 FL=1